MVFLIGLTDVSIKAFKELLNGELFREQNLLEYQNDQNGWCGCLF